MATSKWVIEPNHSEVHFKVKHLVITTVTGNFSEFSGIAEANDDFTEIASVHFDAQIASISTNNETRDTHLKSAEFFAAEEHPTLSFDSTGTIQRSGEEFSLPGTITLRGVSKPLTLKASYGGTNTDPWGNVRVGFEVEGKINRKDFGLSWDVVTEAGSAVVSNEVRLIANVQFVKQA